jgi:RNA polymerase sigma factor (sigma-70 family)
LRTIASSAPRGRNLTVGTEANFLSRANLHEVLIPRIGLLRGYLDRHIPASLRSTLAADDLLQEVWVAAYRTAANFQPDGPDALDRWLITIAHSKLVDAVRYTRRVKRGGDRRYVREAGSPLTSFSGLFARLQSPQLTPSKDVHLIETTHVMLMALNRLSARQRRAIELQFLHGLSQGEIAEQLETTEKAVKELVCRGLHLMRGILGPATKYFTDSSSDDEPSAREPADAQA